MTYLWTKPTQKRAIISDDDYSTQGYRRTMLSNFKHIPGICAKLGFILDIDNDSEQHTVTHPQRPQSAGYAGRPVLS